MMKRGKGKSPSGVLQGSSAVETNSPTLLVHNPSKWQSWWVRFRLSVFMILGFGVIIWIGHWGLIALVLALQIFGYKELSNIRSITLFPNGNLPYSSPWLDIALFFTVEYFFYGFAIFNQFPAFFMETDSILRYFALYHGFISFSLMMVCLVAFVATLEKSLYMQQFQYLTWSMMTMFIVIPSNFHIFNILQGLFWFVLPVSLIICNDITAYIWGFFLGKHSLIQLSPKKTWEGFIGAFFSTIVFSFFIGELLGEWDIFVCPKTQIFGVSECLKSPIFSHAHYNVPALLSEFALMVGIDWTVITMRPAQLYAVYFAIFASTIAPFGGFLASGFKRAYGFKDFGDLIPGHGGIVDRMDCQVMMATFTFVFYFSFISGMSNSSGVMSIISALPLHQQLDLLAKLQTSLKPVTG